MSLEILADRVLLRDSAGNITFDTNERLLHTVEYLSGSITLPRLPYPRFGSPASEFSGQPFHFNQESFFLANLNTAPEIVGGSWAVTDLDGLNTPGQSRFIEEIISAGPQINWYYDYNPGIQIGERHSALGPTTFDCFRNKGYYEGANTVSTRETGDPALTTAWDRGIERNGVINSIHFVAEGTQARLERSGMAALNEVLLAQGVGGPLSAWGYFELPPMTIEFDLWFGRFT